MFKTASGGILISVSDVLNATKVKFETDLIDSESLWLKIDVNTQVTLTFGRIYRSPISSPGNNAFFNQLTSAAD